MSLSVTTKGENSHEINKSIVYINANPNHPMGG